MTAAAQPIVATPRNAAGKGEARRLRAAGQLPAIAYGKTKQAVALAVSPKDVLGLIKSQAGANTLVQVNVEGEEGFLAMIKEYSYHPVTRSLLHVDFIEVKLGEAVEVDVPLVVKGKAAGVTMGGIMRQVFRTLPISAQPDAIPLAIEYDVTGLGLGESAGAKDLQLPAGVSVRLAPDQTVVTIVAPEKDRNAEEGADAKGAPAKDAKKK